MVGYRSRETEHIVALSGGTACPNQQHNLAPKADADPHLPEAQKIPVACDSPLESGKSVFRRLELGHVWYCVYRLIDIIHARFFMPITTAPVITDFGLLQFGRLARYKGIDDSFSSLQLRADPNKVCACMLDFVKCS